MQVVVHPRTAIVLINAHGPQAHHAQIGVGEHFAQISKVLDGNARKLARVLERIVRQARGVFLKRACSGFVDRFAQVAFIVAILVGVADVFGAHFELQVVAHEISIVFLILNKVVRNAVRNGQVGARAEQQNLIGACRSSGFHRGNVDMANAFILKFVRGESRIEHRMRLGHVGTPGDENVGIVEIFIATGGLVGLEHVHEADDGARHAHARVRIDIVGKQAGLPELRGKVAFRNRLLAAAPKRQTALVFLPCFAQLGRHELERFFPTCFAQAAFGALGASVIANKRRSQAIFSIQNLAEVIALHAIQATIRLVVGITGDSRDLPIFRLDKHAAAATAETAHCGMRLRIARALLPRIGLAGACRQTAARRRHRSSDRRSLHEIASRNIHGVFLPLITVLPYNLLESALRKRSVAWLDLFGVAQPSSS